MTRKEYQKEVSLNPRRDALTVREIHRFFGLPWEALIFLLFEVCVQ